MQVQIQLKMLKQCDKLEKLVVVLDQTQLVLEEALDHGPQHRP